MTFPLAERTHFQGGMDEADMSDRSERRKWTNFGAGIVPAPSEFAKTETPRFRDNQHWAALITGRPNFQTFAISSLDVRRFPTGRHVGFVYS
jgi:hypothetical protein